MCSLYVSYLMRAAVYIKSYEMWEFSRQGTREFDLGSRRELSSNENGTWHRREWEGTWW